MSKAPATEFDLLRLFVDEMERQGSNRKLVRLDIDDSFVGQLMALGLETTIAQAQRLADRCLANEWLEHTVMGGKYISLSLTAAGFGVVRSRQLRKQQLDGRGFLKKVSDYIEDHKGLFVALGVVIALAGLLAKLFTTGGGS